MPAPTYPKGIKYRTSTLYLRGLHSHIKSKFKAWCAEHGVTMTEKVEQMMRECIERDRIKQTKKDVGDEVPGDTQ